MTVEGGDAWYPSGGKPVTANRAEQFAILVVTQLDRLVDTETGTGETCCPDCCAPCGVLRQLADANQLDDVIAQAPAATVAGSAWLAYAPLKGEFTDVEWLRSRWQPCGNPGCANTKETTT